MVEAWKVWAGRAGTASARPGCSRLCPAWPGAPQRCWVTQGCPGGVLTFLCCACPLWDMDQHFGTRIKPLGPPTRAKPEQPLHQEDLGTVPCSSICSFLFSSWKPQSPALHGGCSMIPGCLQCINFYCCNNCSVSREMPERAEKIERPVRQPGRR